MNKDNHFIESSRLTKWTKGFLYLLIIASLASIFVGILEYQLLLDFKNGTYETQAQAMAAANASDARTLIVYSFWLAVFIVSAILLLIWIYRANRNARQLGAEGMHYTPGWSVGWYFVPIVNLWKPYMAMREIWKASANPGNWQESPGSWLLGTWWFLWISAGVAGNVASRYLMGADTIDQYITSNILYQISDVLNILLCIVVVFIVGKIYDFQSHHYKALATNSETATTISENEGI